MNRERISTIKNELANEMKISMCEFMNSKVLI